MLINASDDYYTLLGVAPDADEAALRTAWRRVALQSPSDHAGSDPTAPLQMLAVAYAVLSDPVTRAAYDRQREQSTPHTAPPAESVRPKAPGVLLQRLTGSLDALLTCGIARRVDDATVELVINDQEALQGGMVTISMWVPVHCTACSTRTASSCARCGTLRTVDELFSAWLAIPPGVADGTTLAPSVQLRGVVRPVSFRVRLRDAL